MIRMIRIVLISVIVIFIGFMVWHEYTYAMDTVIPFEVNDRRSKTKVLIASQGSSFKDSLVQGILKHNYKDGIYFKVIDVYTLFTVYIDKWDALIIINSWEYGSPPRNVRNFINKHPDKLDKLIILSIVGSSHISLKDVDVISGESIIQKTPKYTNIVVERLKQIIK